MKAMWKAHTCPNKPKSLHCYEKSFTVQRKIVCIQCPVLCITALLYTSINITYTVKNREKILGINQNSPEIFP